MSWDFLHTSDFGLFLLGLVFLLYTRQIAKSVEVISDRLSAIRQDLDVALSIDRDRQREIHDEVSAFNNKLDEANKHLNLIMLKVHGVN